MLVVGGPGFGKTMLLSQAVAENRLAPRGLDLWLTCGPEHAVASTLADALRAAVGASPGGDAGTPAAVADAIQLQAPRQVALLLDDGHELLPGSAGAALLADVLQALPANGHLVIASRTIPSPYPARLDAQGLVTTIGEDDLAFTSDELAEFALLRDVSEDRLHDLEGWPALAELAATSRAGAVADFVWQEVLAEMPAEQRQILACLALLPSFDAELAEACMGRPIDVEAVTAGIPLVLETDDEQRSLHGLWKPALDRELSEADAAVARRRAAWVFAGRGNANTAMRLLLDARAWDDVRDLIVSVFRASHPPVSADVLHGWLTQLPEEVRQTPEGRMLGALAVRPTDGGLSRAAAELEEVAATFAAAGHADGQLAALVQLAYVAWWRERHDILIAVVAQVLELEARGHVAAGPLACIGRAIMADTMADHDRVLAEIDQIPVHALNDEWRSVSEWLRSMALLSKGYARDAIEPAAVAVELASEPLRLGVLGSLLMARWYAGEVDDVLGGMPDMMAMALDSRLPRYVAVAGAQVCLGFAYVGQVDTARPYLDIALEAKADANTLTASHLAIAAAALAVASDDEEEATALLSAELKRCGLLRGLSASAQVRTLPLWYVLLPETRATWDAADLGPTAGDARRLARALTALRESGSLEAIAGLRVPPAAIVRAHLPVPWVARLAVGLIAVDRPEGAALLESVWPVARRTVRALVDEDGSSREPSGEIVARAAKVALASLPAPPREPFHLVLLGPVALYAVRDGLRVPVDAPDWRRERVRSLIAHLVLRPRSTREQVAANLWPELDAAASSRNLRVTLTYLQRALEPDRAEGDASFFVRRDGVRLDLHCDGWLDADVWQFDERLERAAEAERQGAPSLAIGAYEEALALWGGEPLSGVYDEWALPAVADLRQRCCRAAIRLGELVLASGDSERALDLAGQALAIEDWSEPAHRLIVASHLARGDNGSARRALDGLLDLVGDLGGSDETTQMVQRLVESAHPHRPGP